MPIKFYALLCTVILRRVARNVWSTEINVRIMTGEMNKYHRLQDSFIVYQVLKNKFSVYGILESSGTSYNTI